MLTFSSEQKTGKREILRLGRSGAPVDGPPEPSYSYLLTEDGRPLTTESGPRIRLD